MFVGTHDFLSFMKKSKEESTVHFHSIFIIDKFILNDAQTIFLFSFMQKRARFTTRTIDSFTIESGQPIVFINNQNKASDHYEYIDIRIKSRAFVYQQVSHLNVVIISA